MHQRIVSEFGRDVLNAEGIIDRDKLGKIVFTDPAKRRKLDKAGQQSSFLLNPIWPYSLHFSILGMVGILK